MSTTSGAACGTSCPEFAVAADEADHDLKFVLAPVQRLARRTGRHETPSLPPALPGPGCTQLAMGCRTLGLSPGQPGRRTINHDAASPPSCLVFGVL